MNIHRPDSASPLSDSRNDPLCLRDWAAPLLRCPVCHQVGLRRGRDVALCPACAARFVASNGLVNLLGEPHPVVARERAAALPHFDGEYASIEARLAEKLRRLEDGSLSEADVAEFACLGHASQSLAQIRDVLKPHPLFPGEVVVELGADHCWASSLFLDAGCRVIALDITDHLRLAPRGEDPGLCCIVADMNDIPVSDGCADVVWATAAVHHSWSIERTFAETARVLRPGGRLYFCSEPMPSWLRYPFGRGFGRAERARGINEAWLPRRAWVRAAKRAGFAPRVVFPALDRQAVNERLKARRLPVALSPFASLLLRLLQVSVHLLATKA